MTPLFLIMSVLGTFFFSISSRASSFDIPPFTQAIHDAPYIVRGIIGTQFSDWSSDADHISRLYTYFELQTQEVLKGKLPDTQSISIRELGGEKGGVSMHTTGTAEFRQGEDVVVFLQLGNSDHSYDLQGMMLGKYTVTHDSSHPEILMGPGLDTSPLTLQMQPPERVWTLASLRTEIQSQEIGGYSPPETQTKLTPQMHTPPFLRSSLPEINIEPIEPDLQEKQENFLSRPWLLWSIALVNAVFLGGYFYSRSQKK